MTYGVTVSTVIQYFLVNVLQSVVTEPVSKLTEGILFGEWPGARVCTRYRLAEPLQAPITEDGCGRTNKSFTPPHSFPSS